MDHHVVGRAGVQDWERRQQERMDKRNRKRKERRPRTVTVAESDAYANASNHLQRMWENPYSVSLRHQLAVEAGTATETDPTSSEEEREAEVEIPHTESAEADTDGEAENANAQENATRPTTRPSTYLAGEFNWPPEPTETLNLGGGGDGPDRCQICLNRRRTKRDPARCLKRKLVTDIPMAIYCDDLAAPGWMSEGMQERVDAIAEGCAELADIIKATAKCKAMHIVSDKHISMQVGEITEQDCKGMDWNFKCAGCTSPWPTARSLRGHEKTCARARQHFLKNPGSGDQWEIEKLLAVRGPPTHRFWLVKWKRANGMLYPSNPGDGTTKNSDWEHEDELGTQLFRKARPSFIRAGKRDPKEGMVAAYWRTTRQDPSGDYGAPVGPPLEHRCAHCNRMNFETTEAQRHHSTTTCKWRPKKRTGQSVRHVKRHKRQLMHEELAQLRVQGHKLDNVIEWLYLGHWLSSTGDWLRDIEMRCIKADAEFWQLTGSWKSKVLQKKSKLILFFGILQVLLYGCNAWRIAPAAQLKLERWTAEKMAFIKQTRMEEELAEPELRIEYMVRHRRLQWLGEIMRMQENRILHTEVRKYADMILLKLIPKRGSLLHDAPEYVGTIHLREQAGWLPAEIVDGRWVPGEANADGVPWTLTRIQAQVKHRQRWDQRVAGLKAKVWASGLDEIQEAIDKAAEKEKAADAEPDTEKTKEELAVQEADQKAEKEKAADAEKERVRGLGVATDAALAALPNSTIVGYTDGGHIPEKDTYVGGERAGFGWSAHRNPQGQSTSVGEMIDYGFGPVTLDATDKHYVGVDHLSANSAEVTAMTHLLLKVLEWIHRGDTMTDLAICYDSEYAAGWANSNQMGDKNVVAGSLLQGLRRVVEKAGVKIHFIKVKGHMDKYPGFLNTFRCARGNKIADDNASKGMEAEMPWQLYRREEVPQHMR